MIEKTRNKRLFPVFQAAKATMTRMTAKTTPPVVTSTGNPRDTSANAERARGGTTRIVINKTKTSDAIAPIPARLGSPRRRDSKVRSAVTNPASTSSVPRIALRHFENKFRIANCELRISDLRLIALIHLLPQIAFRQFQVRNPSHFAIRNPKFEVFTAGR